MKTLTSLIAIIAFALPMTPGFAQTVNWKSLQPSDKHIINLNAGWDYSTSFALGYGYRFQTRFPLIAGVEISFPSGEDLVDDLKTKMGAQAEVFKYRNFSATVKINGIFRRYESNFVRLANFGSEFSATFGYYTPKWYAAADAGFDKSIITHMKHSDFMKEYYPEIQDGWYIPTGGNFFYGLQLGYSLKSYDLYLKGGKTIAQDLESNAKIPFYLNVGFNKRF